MRFIIYLYVIAIVLQNHTNSFAAGAENNSLPIDFSYVFPTREINVQRDSAPDWRPSPHQFQQIQMGLIAYFGAIENRTYENIYAFFTDEMRKLKTLEEYSDNFDKLNAVLGPVKKRILTKITWTKDPKSAPESGIYAALDIESQYANADRYCGYLVFQQSEGSSTFKLMRFEYNYMVNETAKNIEKSNSRIFLNKTWNRLSKHCPNYRNVFNLEK